MSLKKNRGRNQQNFRTRSIGPHQGQTIFLLKSYPTTKGEHCATYKGGQGRAQFQFKIKRQLKPLATVCIDSTMPKTRKENSATNKISGVDQEYRHLIKGPERKIWEISFANELGQLSQGIREVRGKNTIMFILKYKVNKDKKYGKSVCEMKPEKEEKERTRLTVGGNLLDFTGNLSAPTTSVTT